jgi:hypothetical protein
VREGANSNKITVKGRFHLNRGVKQSIYAFSGPEKQGEMQERGVKGRESFREKQQSNK